jgi:SAM-dependent methyltransferase
LYEAVLGKTGIGPDVSVLDIGCGAGMFCKIVARLGAKVTGGDASAALIAIAKERVPQGNFDVVEMEALPYADGSFDVVTGFNSFQFAANPVNALKEARRVARPGAQVAIATWGKPEDCEAADYLVALGSLLPPPPPGTPGPFALSEESALEDMTTRAGLTPVEAEEVDCPFVYPDLETALIGLMSSGPAVKAIQTSGEDRVRKAVADALAPFRTASGGYRMENKFRYLIATA